MLSTTDVYSASSVTQLDYYNEQGITSSNYSATIKENNNTASTLWLRTYARPDPYDRERHMFRYVDNLGALKYKTGSSSLGISPAFRIE